MASQEQKAAIPNNILEESGMNAFSAKFPAFSPVRLNQLNRPTLVACYLESTVSDEQRLQIVVSSNLFLNFKW